MARERTTNAGTSTLNGGINSSQTTLTVTSAAPFSSLPQFRIIIDSEIMLVTGISGSVFTVTRGAEGSSAASHSNSATIAQIITEEGLQRYHRDWNNPFFDEGTPRQLLDGSTVLTASSFTNVNFTNATKTDANQGSIVLEHDTQSAANDVALIVRSAPTAPWTITCGFIPNLLQEVGDFPSCGFVVHENTSGEFYYFQVNISADGTKVLVSKHASPTASSTSFLDLDNWSGGSGVCWLQVEDNNTNLIFKLSADGVNFITLGQEARTTFLTPDEVGFAINNFGNANLKSMATLVAWDVS